MNTTTQIDKYQDVIDSRDVIARIEELTDERDTWIDEALDGETGPFTDNPNPVSVAADAWEGEYQEPAAWVMTWPAIEEGTIVPVIPATNIPEPHCYWINTPELEEDAYGILICPGDYELIR